MAYEFKKLSDVTLLDSVPSGATVLAEVDGAIRRVPGDGLGGGGGDCGCQRLGGCFFGGVTLEWDGTKEGVEVIEQTVSGASFSMAFAKLSDEPIPLTLPYQITMTTETTASDGAVTTATEEGDETSGDYGIYPQKTAAMVSFGESVIIAYEDFELDGVALTKGVWFCGMRQPGEDGGTVWMYCSKLVMEAGWARWPDFVSGFDKDEAQDYIVLKSTTDGSTKKFKITVNDSGELKATEIT